MAHRQAALGLTLYNEFREAYHAGEMRGVSTAEVTARAITAATALAFANELYAKALVFQRIAAYPQGHKISELLVHLPAEATASVTKRFDHLMATTEPALRIQVGLAKTLDPLGAYKRISFPDAVDQIADMFVKLRYLYETFDRGFDLLLDFHALLLVVDALQADLWEYAGGSLKLKFGTSTATLTPNRI